MKKAISMMVVLLMLMSGFTLIAEESIGTYGSGEISADSQSPISLTSSHAPIRVNNNSDLASIASSGSGTQADPYIIENYDINGGGYGYCIYIGNTTDYFVARNCSLYNVSGNSGTYYWNSGLIFYNVSNGVSLNNTIFDIDGTKGGGIYTYSSESIVVSNNTIFNITGAASSAGAGIFIQSLTNSTIANNTIFSVTGGKGGTGGTYGSGGTGGIGAGIYLQSSTNNTVAKNNISSITGGTGGTGGEYGSGGTGGIGAGIYLQSSTNNTLANNYISSVTGGAGGAGGHLGSTGASQVGFGIYIDANSLDNSIGPTNTINGDPIIYYYGQTGITIENYVLENNSNPTNYGKITLINCTNFSIRNNRIANYTGMSGLTSTRGLGSLAGAGGIGTGIYLQSSTDGTIANTTISSITGGTGGTGGYYGTGGTGGIGAGIYLQSSTNATIANNTVSSIMGGIGGTGGFESSGGTGGIGAGIYLQSSTNATIANNTVSSIMGGIGGTGGFESSGGTGGIGAGIYLQSSTNNTLANNYISSVTGGAGGTGGYLGSTGASQVGFGIYIDANSLDNSIEPTNRINGDPIIYYYGQNGINIENYVLENKSNPTNYGKITLINCSNFTVQNNSIANYTGMTGITGGYHAHGGTGGIGAGIYLQSSTNATIANNTVSSIMGGIGGTGGYYGTGGTGGIGAGIYLQSSDNNTIKNNTISAISGGDGGAGGFYRSNGAEGIGVGTYILSSGNNSLTGCTLLNNNFGVYLSSSNRNLIYHNNFINNTNQAYDNTGTNSWNAPYPTGGNYWSNYNGTDNYSGPGQNITGCDRIGDTPYMNISGGAGAQDNYPLMYPFNGDGVNPISPYWRNTVLNISAIATNAEYVELWYSYASINGSYGNYSLFANDTDSSDGWSWTFDFPDGDGWYRFYSISGNSSSGYRDLPPDLPDAECGYDVTPPSIIINSPINGTITNTSSMTIMWAGNDSVSGIDHYEIRIDGGSWLNVGTSTSHDFTSLSDGSHTADVKAVDNAGNEATDIVTFTTDTTNPTVTITSPSDNSIFNTSSVTVQWTGSDSASGIDHYEIRIDGGSWTNVGTSTSYDFIGLNDGSHTVNAKALDKTGNEAIDTVTFTTDTTSPTISITSPPEGATVSTSNVTVTWRGDDADSGINHYEVSIDNGSWINAGTNTSHILSGLSDGSHTIGVKAVDNAGNERTSQVNFEVNTGSGGGQGGSGEGGNNQTNGNLLWIFIVLIILILAGVLAVILMKKRSGKENDETETPENEEDIKY